MAQQVKTLSVKPDNDLSWTPQIYRVKRQNQLLQLPSGLHMHSVVFFSTPPQTSPQQKIPHAMNK